MSELDRTAKARAIVAAALELKAESPQVLDMREVSSFADTFILLSGRSSRHVRSIADAILKTLQLADEEILGVEGLKEATWVLIDANDAIVHIFAPDTRDEFDLGRLWSDAPRIGIREELGLDYDDEAEPESPASKAERGPISA